MNGKPTLFKHYYCIIVVVNKGTRDLNSLLTVLLVS